MEHASEPIICHRCFAKQKNHYGPCEHVMGIINHFEEKLSAVTSERDRNKQEADEAHSLFQSEIKESNRLGSERDALAAENARLKEERDAAVRESNRRDEKWIAGIKQACGTEISFDIPCFENRHTPSLDEFIRALRADLVTAREDSKTDAEAMNAAYLAIVSLDLSHARAQDDHVQGLLDYAKALLEGRIDTTPKGAIAQGGTKG